jgi:hypothetical protein
MAISRRELPGHPRLRDEVAFVATNFVAITFRDHRVFGLFKSRAPVPPGNDPGHDDGNEHACCNHQDLQHDGSFVRATSMAVMVFPFSSNLYSTMLARR